MLQAEVLRSSTLKLALVYVAVFGAAVYALIGYVYWSAMRYVADGVDRAVGAEEHWLLAVYESHGRYGLVEAIRERIQRGEETIYLVTAPSLLPLAGNIKRWPEAARGSAGSADLLQSPSTADTRDEPLVRARYDTLSGGEHLLVGKAADTRHFVETIRIGVAGTSVLIVILAVAAGISVTRRTVGRIETINAVSREIMMSGFGQRIPLRGTKDEWDQLAANLNAMLDRIQTLVAQLKQVSDNVAHGLRTPLTRLRGRLERACEQTLGPDESYRLARDAIVELDAVLKTFSSLLRISQVEAANQRASFRRVGLTELAIEVVELFEPAAEARGARISLSVSKGVLVDGDRDLLFEMIGNIVDNAIKHAGEQGDVVVRTMSGSDGPSISVSDRGPGIPVDQRERVFKRFYRLERSRSTPGNGLGLSLVAAVAQLHDARIELRDNSPGLVVHIRFPGVA